MTDTVKAAAKAKRTIWPRVPSGFVKGQLLAHKLLGLVLAAVMYLVCITGTVAVFYGEFQRWEQPAAPEMAYASPEAIGRAVANTREHIARTGAKPTDVYIITPSVEMPRIIADYETDALAFDAKGEPAGSGEHNLTHFLVEMHYELNLPGTIGFVMIGVLGVLLVALIVGGALALPRMFRDAFTLRIDGGRRMSRVDIHNRIAVWGLPFHFIVALSGAIMGLALLVIALAAPIQFQGDSLKAMASMFGDPGKVAAEARKAGPPPAMATPEPRIVTALQTLARERPDNPPIYIGISQFGTPNELLTIGAKHGDRLIYTEGYRFNSAGGLMGKDGYSDGEVGRQVYVSMFRVHAGAFGGMGVKLVYVVLGLGLSLLCTTGVDIWLAKSAAKGRDYPRVQSAWTTFVWMTPALVAVSCALAILASVPPAPFFWISLPLVTLAGIWVEQRRLHWLAPLAAGVLVLGLPLTHLARHGEAALSPAAFGVNLGLILTAVAIIGLAVRNWRKAGR
ncbi:PepSY-associated TM helix domain-containing protein [Caulobacter segnis]|uniref:PepSY-associated TM helix domain-containing protein n=1 Tax=Caulobacter segnis TaxID=88688 RepID=UPI00240FEF86|nr:PepSY-associated TM helix domain-containing protein [Caulobacter segnis]MDG2521573.1 PepSY-associated TM helix domain-containing protein [Caulobacter segnis]